MTDNMIVKPVTTVSRRRFFMFLGAAAISPIIHHIIPEKLIFDMSGPVTATVPWRHYFKSVSIPIEDITDRHILDEMNRLTMRYIVPALTDEIFKPSPFWSAQLVNKSGFGSLSND